MLDFFRRLGKNLIHFFSSRIFIQNFLAVFVAGIIFFLLVILSLRIYTRHGQKLKVKDYTNTLFKDAWKDADSEGLKLVVEDSVFIVGQPGGMIISQNPASGSFVKRGRRIYLTITKYKADDIPLSALPALYGQEVNAASKVLKQRFGITTEILGSVFDEGPPNMILAVVLEGDTIISQRRKPGNRTIYKGATLGLVVSKDVSESVRIPDLVCQTFTQADFLMKANQLTWGQIMLDDNVTNRHSAYVYRQHPVPEQGVLLTKGDTIRIWLTQARPASCPFDEIE